MSCFFCGSYYHSSQHCNVCVSGKDRKRIALSKNCCWNCLADINGNEVANKYASLSNKERCTKCSIYEKCYICFSRWHHTVYCPRRFTVPHTTIFLPKIDKIIIKRYIECLNYLEQFSLTCTLPEALKYIKLQPLRVGDFYECIDNNSDDSTYNKTNVFANTAYFRNSVDSFFSSKEFLHLLSFNTKEIHCWYANLTTNLEFVEILKKAPNISTIDLWKINVITTKSWPNVLMKWKYGSDLEYLKIAINDFDFEVEALAQLIKTKSINTSQFFLFFETNDSAIIYEKKYIQFSTDLQKYFYKVEEALNDETLLTIVTSKGIEKYHCL